jgi:hypothetical protein
MSYEFPINRFPIGQHPTNFRKDRRVERKSAKSNPTSSDNGVIVEIIGSKIPNASFVQSFDYRAKVKWDNGKTSTIHINKLLLKH